MAKLYFRYGAMGSSKTANAIMVRYNYLERGGRVLMLKPRPVSYTHLARAPAPFGQRAGVGVVFQMGGRAQALLG